MGVILALMAMGMLLGLGAEPIEDPLDEDADGSEDGDRLGGTDGDNMFRGGGGHDLLFGAAGNDLLQGNDGNDWIFGMGDADTLSGDDGNDVLAGGAGFDELLGGSGDDFIESANLLDQDRLEPTLSTAQHFDQIEFQYDMTSVGDTSDIVDAGDGNDTVVVGRADTVVAGAGIDLLSLGDWIEGGPPAVLSDFDPEEDVLTFAYDSAQPIPKLTLEDNPFGSGVILLSDGNDIALMPQPGLSLDVSDIMLIAYTR